MRPVASSGRKATKLRGLALDADGGVEDATSMQPRHLCAHRLLEVIKGIQFLQRLPGSLIRFVPKCPKRKEALILEAHLQSSFAGAQAAASRWLPPQMSRQVASSAETSQG